jgi:hypothetical protein
VCSGTVLAGHLWRMGSLEMKVAAVDSLEVLGLRRMVIGDFCHCDSPKVGVCLCGTAQPAIIHVATRIWRLRSCGTDLDL